MKWTDHKGKLKADGVDPTEWGNYKVYDTKAALDADIDNKAIYEVWETFSDLPKKLTGNRKAQRKYEIYCGGFLYYHDVEFKKYHVPGAKNSKGEPYPTQDFEHFIYFDWEKKDGSVTIYITITPEAYNPTPPKPPAPPPPES